MNRGVKPTLTVAKDGQLSMAPLAGGRLMSAFNPGFSQDKAKVEFFRAYKEKRDRGNEKNIEFKYITFAGDARVNALKAVFDVGKRLNFFSDADWDRFVTSHPADHEKFPKDRDVIREFCHALVTDIQCTMVPTSKEEIERVNLVLDAEVKEEEDPGLKGIIQLAEKVSGLEKSLGVQYPLDVESIKNFDFGQMRETLDQRLSCVLDYQEIIDLRRSSKKGFRNAKIKAYLDNSTYWCTERLEDFQLLCEPNDKEESHVHDGDASDEDFFGKGRPGKA